MCRVANKDIPNCVRVEESRSEMPEWKRKFLEKIKKKAAKKKKK